MNNFKFDLEITEEESSGQNFSLCKRLLKNILINSIIDHCSYGVVKCNYEIRNYTQLMMIMDLMGI